MNDLEILYFFIVSFPPFISGAVSLYIWRYRSTRAAIPLLLLLLAITVWSAFYALELFITQNLALKTFFASAKYLGITLSPVAWLAFALQYTNREKWLTPRNILLLCVLPTITAVLCLTNSSHEWVWSHIQLVPTGPFQALTVQFEPWFWVHAGYTYLLMLFGSIYLFLFVFQSPDLYRWQVNTVLLGAIIPWFGNALTIFQLNPLAPLDLTPLMFTLSGFACTAALFRFRLLDISPIARTVVFENLSDGVVVLDKENRIADMNPAAQRLLRMQERGMMIGETADALFAPWPHLLEQFRHTLQTHTEITVGTPPYVAHYDLTISPVTDTRRKITGRVVLFRDITLRRQAEEEQQKLSFLVEYSSDFIGMASLEGKILFLNRAGQWLVGINSLAEAQSKHMLEFFQPEDLPEFQEQILPGVLEFGHVETEFHFKHFQTNRPIPIYFSVFLIRHPETHQPLALASISRDMTSQKTAEAELLAQKQLFENLVAVARATTERPTLAATLQSALEIAIKLTGAAGGSLFLLNERREVVDSIFSHDGEVFFKQQPHIMQRVIQDGFTGWLIKNCQAARITNTLEDSRWLDLSDMLPPTLSALGVPILNKSTLLGVLVLNHSEAYHFTDQHLLLMKAAADQISLALSNAQLYQTITDERGQLQAIMSASRDGIVLIGQNGRILVTNTAAIQLLHMEGTPEDWINRPLSEWLRQLRRRAPQVVRAALQNRHGFAVGDEPPASGEYHVPPHTIRWMNLPVTAGHSPLGRLVVLHDVTEERLLNDLRDDLTYTMVHDLRNPLSSLQMALQMLKYEEEGELSAGQRRVVDIALTSSERMLGLVNAILDVSRLENGQMPLSYEEVPLNWLTENTVETQLPLAAKKNITVENLVSPELPYIRVDVGLVERVLQNLAGNAIKFTQESGWVRITAETPSSASFVSVSVADNGSGIPEEIRGKLFQKFVTGRQKGRGSGLGLAFCRLAIEAHGGQIRVESETGRGTTFTFTLPLATPKYTK